MNWRTVEETERDTREAYIVAPIVFVLLAIAWLLTHPEVFDILARWT